MRKIFLSLALMLGIAGSAYASGLVYTAFVESEGTLTYYFDDQYLSRPGVDKIEFYDITSDKARFVGYNEKITSVIIDPSMKDASLTSMEYMFHGGSNYVSGKWEYYPLTKVTSITGLGNLKTSGVTSMRCMFLDMVSLTSLDLSTFDFTAVNDIYYMFNGCQNLEAIYCEADLTGVSISTDMFYFCNKLKGDKGTAYATKKVANGTYAHLDGGETNPGYFSVPKQVYTEFVESAGTLTYYYDSQKTSRTGTVEVYYQNDPKRARFVDYKEKVTSIVIDPSMQDAPLTEMDNFFHGGEKYKSGKWEYYPLTKVTSITGLENLKTAKVTSMRNMFLDMVALPVLDLTSFDFSSVDDVYYMFNGCQNLETIYCEADLTGVSLSTDMFYFCQKLKGDQGTTYAAKKVANATYAHLDGGETNPGYFSKKPASGINQVANGKSANGKLIRNGQLFIERDGEIFNATGARVK